MRVGAVVLAAGRSTRYRAAGGRAESKLVDLHMGVPLVTHATRAALSSCAEPVVVVTGHAQPAVEAALTGLSPLVIVHNPAYASGLASSLNVGIAAVGDRDGVVVLLGDMPRVTAAIIDALVAAAIATTADAVVPMVGGERGNPVLLCRTLFARTTGLTGDEGARRLLQDETVRVLGVAMPDAATLFDVDGPD